MKFLIKKRFRFKRYFIFEKNYLFFKKLFCMFTKNGLKFRVINMYIKFINIIKKKISRKVKKGVSIYVYQVFKKALPILNSTFFFKRGAKITIPKLNKNNFKKLSTISSLWFKKSVYLRKEKTLFLKIYSEIESIRKNKASFLTFKKNYYLEFYKNKRFLKFFKRKKWI